MFVMLIAILPSIRPSFLVWGFEMIFSRAYSAAWESLFKINFKMAKSLFLAS